MRFKAVLSASVFVICMGLFSCAVDNGGIIGIDVRVDSGVVGPGTPYLVKRVDRSSPAYEAGVEPGDEIIQINQTEIRDGMVFRDIYNTMLTGKPGTKITLYVRRNGRVLVFDIVMAGRR